MPIYVLDSSAVIKLYRPETGSDAVTQLLSGPDVLAFISRLAVVEVQRAFARRMRENEISAAEMDELRDGFYQDLQRRRFWVRRLREFHYHAAVRLVRRYAPERLRPLPRTLDAVHLAVALDVRAREGLDFFVSADKNLCEIAEAEQLRILNPESS